MYKPNSLRAHLAAAVPDLKRNPDKLHIFSDEGSVHGTATGSLSFEYQYTLNIIVEDYSGSADAIMVPLLAWVAVHQIDLLANPDKRKNGIQFEVDFNNNQTIDLSIKIALTERVGVAPGTDGRLNIRHLAEPQLTPVFSDEFWTLYDGDTLIAEWQTPTVPTP